MNSFLCSEPAVFWLKSLLKHNNNDEFLPLLWTAFWLKSTVLNTARAKAASTSSQHRHHIDLQCYSNSKHSQLSVTFSGCTHILQFLYFKFLMLVNCLKAGSAHTHITDSWQFIRLFTPQRSSSIPWHRHKIILVECGPWRFNSSVTTLDLYLPRIFLSQTAKYFKSHELLLMVASHFHELQDPWHSRPFSNLKRG